jgi:hypothetical protein
MNTNKRITEIEDVKINVKLKLSALWTAVMFLYVYADIKALFRPGILEQMIAGELSIGGTGVLISQTFLLVSAIIMAIPSVMILLSLTLKARVNRWVNIILGIVYTAIIIMTLLSGGAWAYYIFYAIIEIVLTTLVVWYAWKWPKQDSNV